MKEIDAVNLMLNAVGHQTTNSLSTTDPTVNKAKGILTQARRRVLAKGFRGLNRFEITLAADASGRVPVSRSYIKVEYPDVRYATRLDTSTGDLNVWNHSTKTWHSTDISGVFVVVDIESMRDIPEEFAEYIAYEAARGLFGSLNLGGRSEEIESNLQDARSTALNTLPPADIHKATGRTAVRRGYDNPISNFCDSA